LFGNLKRFLRLKCPNLGTTRLIKAKNLKKWNKKRKVYKGENQKLRR